MLRGHDVEEQQVELLWLNILKWLSSPLTCQVPIPPQIIEQGSQAYSLEDATEPGAGVVPLAGVLGEHVGI